MTLRRSFAFYCFTLVCVTLLLILLNACRPVGVTGASATATAQEAQYHEAFEEWREVQP